MKQFGSMQLTVVMALMLALGAPPAHPRSASAGIHHLLVRATLSPQMFHGAVSGRMIVLLAKGTGKQRLELGSVQQDSWIAAREVDGLTPGGSVDVDADEVAFPTGFSDAPSGDYQLQVFLDEDHSYAYNGVGPGDLFSEPLTLTRFTPAVSEPIAVLLDNEVPPSSAPPAPAGIEPLKFESPSLTAFWGRPIDITGYVVLPPSYLPDKRTRYPTVYWTHGFGGTLARIEPVAEQYRSLMASKDMPEMIWVMLNQAFSTGTTEFADSVNNGPWGLALTSELIPRLERQYRMDAKPNGRFLTGHSSGGWATLWLQVAYPAIFGGTWSTAPDPSDFRSFTGIDIYAPNANAYRKPDGSPWMLIRMDGHDVFSFEQHSRREAVTGEYGGQNSSFDSVFSPKGADGRPMPLFDRATGIIDSRVADYWGAHYDIARKIAREWPRTAKDLRGKIHVIVGEADTYHLDEAARLLEADLRNLDARAAFTYIPGKTHSDLYVEGSDRRALTKKIAEDMHAIARPSK
jgi:hypothetical protein